MVSEAVLGSGLSLMIPEVFSNLNDSGVSPGFGTCFSHCPCSRNTQLGCFSSPTASSASLGILPLPKPTTNPGTVIPTPSKALGCFTPVSSLSQNVYFLSPSLQFMWI